MFKPGQEVVCINDKLKSEKSPLVYGRVYTIIDCKKETCKCGEIVVNIGIIDRGMTNYYTHIRCRYCDVLMPITNNFWWFLAKRFVPKEDWQQAETMVEVLKEDLELQAV